MAKKIETATDVVEWAKSVVEAKGEKFTALSKGEQYEIAKYISEMTPLGALGEDKGDNEDKEDAPPCLPEEEELPCQSVVEEPKDGGTWKEPDPPKGWSPEPHTSDVNLFPQVPTATTVTMTRGYVYHQMGLDAQQTFDKFLAWGKDHPKELTVMDFSTGRKSTDAAFAYWLNEIMPVNIPHKV